MGLSVEQGSSNFCEFTAAGDVLGVGSYDALIFVDETFCYCISTFLWQCIYKLIVSFWKATNFFRTASPLKMRPIGCLETSATDTNLRFNYREMAGHVYIGHFIEQETDSNQKSSGFHLFVSCVCVF
jgi:hypothetical protein